MNFVNQGIPKYKEKDMGSKADYGSLPDAELVALLKRSDPSAFTEIYNRFSYSMIAHACRKLREEDVAKDIVQELFTNLWQKREHEIPADYLENYLFKILKNKILNYFAHQDVRAKYSADVQNYSLQGSERSDYLIREKQLQTFIDKEIKELPPKTRIIFEMSRYQQLTHKEIAERLNTNEVNVTKQISNALKVLKTKLHPLVWVCLYTWLH